VPSSNEKPEIDLRGKPPKVKRAVNYRLFFLLLGIALLLVGSLIFGVMMRKNQQTADARNAQQQQMAADVATSDRQKIESDEAMVNGNPPGPQTAPQAATNGASAANGYPTQPAYSGYAPAVYQPLSDQVVQLPTQQQMQAPPPQPPEDPQKKLQDEERQVREAPTVLRVSGSSSTPVVPSFTLPVPAVGDPLLAPHLSSATGSTEMPGISPLVGVRSSTADSFRAQNGQAEKEAFAEEPEGAPNPADDYLKATRTDPISTLEIQQGTLIPAILEATINSDVPGKLRASVRRDVLDSLKHRYVLIPEGSILLGEYNSNLSFGQNRVQVVWTRILFPDTTFIDLGRFGGYAADGASGLKDKTDNHMKSVATTVGLLSVFQAGLQVSQNRAGTTSVLEYPSTGQVIAGSVGQQATEAGRGILERNLNRQPTLKIRSGDVFLVRAEKDIVFDKPYTPRY